MMYCDKDPGIHISIELIQAEADHSINNLDTQPSCERSSSRTRCSALHTKNGIFMFNYLLGWGLSY